MSSQKKNNARMPDTRTLIQAGIDPKTGLPLKMKEKNASCRKDNIVKILRISDEQSAINRYTWYNLPDITSQELERLIYYKGQICVFYNPTLDRFFYLPYALDGSIDLYGRFMTVHPVPLGATSGKDKEKRDKELNDWLTSLHLDVAYDIILPEKLTLDVMDNSTVLIHDYSKQLSQTIIPRQELNEGLIDIEADCIPFMRTALLNATGVQAIRVGNQTEAPQIYQASEAINEAALAGEKYIPIIGSLDFQELTGGNPLRAEEFLLAMQSIDNIRLGTYGLENGGIFQKKSHELQTEAEMATSSASLALQDGLAIRQHACNVINSIWGLGVWCEISEVASGADKNFDGEVSDEQDGQEAPADNMVNQEANNV